MKVEEMRNAVTSVYSGPAWRLKVQQMPDRQVIAIFRSMVEEGRLSKGGKIQKRAYQPNSLKTSKNDDSICEQLTIWDLLNNER